MSVAKTGLWPHESKMVSSVDEHGDCAPPPRGHTASVLHPGGLRLTQKPWTAMRSLSHQVWLVFASASRPELRLLSELARAPPRVGSGLGDAERRQVSGGQRRPAPSPAASGHTPGCALTVGAALPLPFVLRAALRL